MLKYKTETNWRRELGADEMILVNAKLAELIAQGKTDGIRHAEPYTERDDSDIVNPITSFTIERYWATEEDAQAWIDFFSDFNPPIWRSKISVRE